MKALNKYFTYVPILVSLALNFLLGWAASVGVLFAALSGGLGGMALFIIAAAGGFILLNWLACVICEGLLGGAASNRKKEPRFTAFRAAAVFCTFIFMAGSFFWAGDLWLKLNGWWF